MSLRLVIERLPYASVQVTNAQGRRGMRQYGSIIDEPIINAVLTGKDVALVATEEYPVTCLYPWLIFVDVCLGSQFDYLTDLFGTLVLRPRLYRVFNPAR
jgi:hypothetical protein